MSADFAARGLAVQAKSLANSALQWPGAPTTIKDSAATLGLKFGVAYKPDDPNDTTAYRNLVLSEASLLIPEAAALATTWCTARATYDFTRMDQFLAIAQGAGLPWKVPSGFIYPAHDMSWVNTSTVTSANWQAIIDELVARFKLYCDTKNSYPVAINASNELTDPTTGDGWRRNPWYTATAGPGWLVYLIQKLKATFPGIPIGLCQDQLEQPDGSAQGDHYGTDLQAAFLNNLDTLIAAGAKPDYVDAQGHLRDDRGWKPVAFRTLLASIRAKGIKLVAGEIDYRMGTPANYSTAAYDRRVAESISQYLDVLIPNLDGGLIAAWTIGDTFNSWGATQRPTLYDTSLAVKAAYYAAYVENLNWR